MQRGDDGATDQADGLARGVQGLARFFEAARSDVVVVLGDRIEALAGALAATTTGRAVAHLHGGDAAPGDFDDTLRHAITKLAHFHFTATKRSTRRVIRLGEDPRRVFWVGAPGLDRLREIIAETPPIRAPSGLALVAYHAYGRSAAHEQRVASRVLAATAAAGLRRCVLCPNSDRGHDGVFAAIERHAERSRPGEVEVVKSLPRDAFLRRLLDADVLIGNSSAGIIEAPLAGTPTVNVGDRQRGREVGGRSVVHVAETREAIDAGLARALQLRPRRGGATVYGAGDTGRQVAEVLGTLELTPELLHKTLTY